MTQQSFLNWHSLLWIFLTWTSAFSAWAQPYPATYQLENPRGGIWANMPYRLYFNDGTKIIRAPSEVEVIEDEAVHGITDSKGFTSVILLDKSPKAEDVILIRRVGSGYYGITMRLIVPEPKSDEELVSNNQDKKESVPFTNVDYRMKICNRKTFRGITNKNGLTYYYTSKKPCDASLYLWE
jgi:hypothetical protein